MFKRVLLSRNKVIPQDSIAHVVQRAPGRELLFVEDADYLYFLHLLKDISKKYKWKVFSFALLPNHYHLLLKFSEDNAYKSIKNLNERYAIFFNNKYERKGHVFYGSYRVSLCFDESYLLVASLYIHLNPLKAGLTNSLHGYRWSSCSLYLRQNPPKTFLDCDFILKLLDLDLCKAKREYGELLEMGLKKEISSILEDKRALGKFRISIFKEILEKFKRKKGVSKELLEEMGFERKIQKFKKKRRIRDGQERKALRYLIEQLMSRGFSIEEIAERLERTPRSIYRLLNVTNKVLPYKGR